MTLSLRAAFFGAVLGAMVITACASSGEKFAGPLPGTLAGDAAEGRVDVVLDRLLQPARPTDAELAGALAAAVRHRQAEMVRVLLEHGAPLAGGLGSRLLMLSARIRDAETVHVLLMNGAPVLATDHAGRTPMHLMAGDPDLPRDRIPDDPAEPVIEELIFMGANIDARDRKGRTPLMYAAAHGDMEAVRALLERLPELNAYDTDGKTALDHALDNGYETVGSLLFKLGVPTRRVMGRSPGRDGGR